MQSDKVASYLGRLAAELDHRGVACRDEIVLEIGGHLQHERHKGEAWLDAALADLGLPEELARTYQAETIGAVTLPSSNGCKGSLDMRMAGRAAADLGAGLLTIPIFVLCASFLWLAFTKLLSPESVPGIVGKFNLGALVRTPEAHEFFGWILLPTGLAVAAICFFSGSRILRRAVERLRDLHHQSWRISTAL